MRPAHGVGASGAAAQTQCGDEPDRLGGDAPRHLRLALLTVAEDDRDLDDAEPAAQRA